jgi:translation initiation factor IF-3
VRAPGHPPHPPFQEASISAEPRINDRIRVPEVRLVGPNGEQVGIVAIGEALQLAQEKRPRPGRGRAHGPPPVCKLMDYGKFKYETAQKARESRKNQVLTVIKEMKLRPKIDPHDYETKKGHVVRFLKAGRQGQDHDHVPRSRAVAPRAGLPAAAAPRRGRPDLGFVESAPKQDGRNMIMVLAPHKNAADLKKAAGRARTRRTRAGPATRPAQIAAEAPPARRR